MPTAAIENSDQQEAALYAEVARRIRETRLQKNVTQQKLADLIGAQRSFIFELEHGTGNPTIRTLYRVAKALDVTPGTFIPQASPGDLDVSAARLLQGNYATLLALLTHHRDEQLKLLDRQVDAARSFAEVLDQALSDSATGETPGHHRGS